MLDYWECAKECSYNSSHNIWPHLNWPHFIWPHFIWNEWQWVHCEATQFIVAAANQTGQHHLRCSGWSQPRQTGSLHSTITATQFRWNKVSWDELRWLWYECFLRLSVLCPESVLWQNSWMDLDAILGGEWSRSSDRCIRWRSWGGDHQREMGSFGGEFGASHCNQWGLCSVAVREQCALPKLLWEDLLLLMEAVALSLWCIVSFPSVT